MVYVAASGTPNPEKCPGHRVIAADISLPAIPGESEPGNPKEQVMVYVARRRSAQTGKTARLTGGISAEVFFIGNSR